MFGGKILILLLLVVIIVLQSIQMVRKDNYNESLDQGNYHPLACDDASERMCGQHIITCKDPSTTGGPSADCARQFKLIKPGKKDPSHGKDSCGVKDVKAASHCGDGPGLPPWPKDEPDILENWFTCLNDGNPKRGELSGRCYARWPSWHLSSQN